MLPLVPLPMPAYLGNGEGLAALAVSVPFAVAAAKALPMSPAELEASVRAIRGGACAPDDGLVADPNLYPPKRPRG